jgi:hypothetical protein
MTQPLEKPDRFPSTIKIPPKTLKISNHHIVLKALHFSVHSNQSKKLGDYRSWSKALNLIQHVEFGKAPTTTLVVIKQEN